MVIALPGYFGVWLKSIFHLCRSDSATKESPAPLSADPSQLTRKFALPALRQVWVGDIAGTETIPRRGFISCPRSFRDKCRRQHGNLGQTKCWTLTGMYCSCGWLVTTKQRRIWMHCLFCQYIAVHNDRDKADIDLTLRLYSHEALINEGGQ